MALLSLPPEDLCSPGELGCEHLLAALAALGASGTTPRREVAAACVHWGICPYRGSSSRAGQPSSERGDPGYEQKLGGWGRGAVRAALPTRITKKQRGVKPHS